MKRKDGNLRPYISVMLRGNGGTILLGVLRSALNTVGGLMLGIFLKKAIDLMAQPYTAGGIKNLLLFAIATMLTLIAADTCRYQSGPRFVSRAMAQYQNFVYGKLMEKSMASLSGEGSGRYLSALSNDASAIETNCLARIFPLADALISITASLALMAWYSPLLTAISLCISFLPMWMSFRTGGKSAKAEKKVSEENTAYVSSLRDSLMGFDVIKAFRAEHRMQSLFADKVQEVMKAREYSRKLKILVEVLAMLSGAAVQIGVFLVGVVMTVTGTGMTAGTVMLFIQLLNYVLQPLSSIPGDLAGIRSGLALIRRLADALEESTEEKGTETIEGLHDEITVQDVTFGYEQDRPILKDLNVTFEAGRSYAVVGASGSGKSTLLRLLAASCCGYSGSVRYDGTEVRNIKSSSLYGVVSVIQQNVFIFDASIRDNITMFAEFSDSEIRHAAELAGLSPLLAEKGEGYLCGENGCNLSGGEKQRISIARSLLRKSSVLLADEVTAALDRETAWQVSDAILNLTDMTRIVVTHALDEAVLRRYDRILAVKAGQIVEAGSFKSLMEKKGYFYALYTVSQ